MTIGIYQIRCNDTNETYYGSSMNIEKRKKKNMSVIKIMIHVRQ